MQPQSSIPPSYEVLLHVATGRNAHASRWYLAGSSASRSSAGALYREVCEEFPKGATVLLIASTHEETSNLFRDQIIEANTRAPLIDRKRMAKLSSENRHRLARTVRATTELRTKREKTSQPQTRSNKLWWPLTIMSVAACAAGFVAYLTR